MMANTIMGTELLYDTGSRLYQNVNWIFLLLLALFFAIAGIVGFILGFYSVRDKPQSHLPTSQKQKLEALGQLAAGMAHDFNNILSVVEGYSRLMAGDIKNKKHHEYIRSILEMTEKGANLTRQLLAFGHQRIIAEKTCDMVDTIDKQMVMLRPLMGENIDIVYIKHEYRLSVLADEQSIWQIVMNLATNARDAIDGQGQLDIVTGMADENIPVSILPKPLKHRNNASGYAYFSVRDNGKGMNERVRRKVFEPFFTTKDQGKGTGLGLSMVYGIVSQLKGYIDIQSEEGKGTIVTVFLPLAKGEYQQNVLNPYPHEISGLAGKTIMIVDDEPRLTFVLKNTLEKAGMNVLVAHSANEALAIQDEYEKPIHFLLSDIVMPEVSGDKLAGMFLDLRKETQVLFMSGYPTKGDCANVNLPENAVILQKPFQEDELQNHLHYIWRERKIKTGT